MHLGGIKFMLCDGEKLIMELSKSTTSAPFEYATMIENWIEKSGVKLEPPTMSDYAKSVNYGRQLGFVKQ